MYIFIYMLCMLCLCVGLSVRCMGSDGMCVCEKEGKRVKM